MFNIYANAFLTAARMEARAPTFPAPRRKRWRWWNWKG
jgi:hypothetical protein